jgi:RNA polymerase sigma factor (sigma-70 family)
MSTTPTLSPSELVQLALREHESALVGHAYNVLHDIGLARDAVQDAFLKLFQQPEGKVAVAALKSWMFTVVTNRCIDILRKRKRIVSLDDIDQPDIPCESPPPGSSNPTAQAELVLKYLKRLSPNHQEVIRLKFQADLSYKEIAEATGLTVTNVGFILHAALKRLRGFLSPGEQ